MKIYSTQKIYNVNLLYLIFLLIFIFFAQHSHSQPKSTTFVDSGQILNNPEANDASLGDLDKDGDLDLFEGNGKYGIPSPSKVWFNNGSGIFTQSSQTFDRERTYEVELADLDKDGDLDAFCANFDYPDTVWFNNGSGIFTDSGQSLGSYQSLGIDLGDVDSDGDLDAFVANQGQPCKVWINNGSGTFSDSGQSLGDSESHDVALGDLDGDNDLDAFIANGFIFPNTVWLNNGTGIFTDSGQSLGNANSQGVALGDVDNDGDLDAVIANAGGQNELWINQGGIQGGTEGVFSNSGQNLGTPGGWRVSSADLDNDGDVDALFPYVLGNKIKLNDGSGIFTDSGLTLGTSSTYARADIGDIDKDSDLDIIITDDPNCKVWFNVQYSFQSSFFLYN